MTNVINEEVDDLVQLDGTSLVGALLVILCYQDLQTLDAGVIHLIGITEAGHLTSAARQ